MSRKSTKSSKTRIDTEPIPPQIMRRARKLAHEYRILLETNHELGFIGSSIELPAVFADGRSPDDCVKATRKALSIAVGTMLEQGQQPPSPACKGFRKAQVNVRLTTDEKFRLLETARRLGFKGLGDFIRTTALDRCASL